MRKTKEEKGLLAKLASGALDGMVGNEKIYRGYKKCIVENILRTGNPFLIGRGNPNGFLTVKRMNAFQERERRSTTTRTRRNWIFFKDMAGLRTMKT